MFKYVRCTLVLILRENEILLGMKKRGFGVGKWNGFGGKVRKDESLKQGAVRELYEECSLHVKETDLKQIGILLFEMQGDKEIIEANIFTTSTFTGTPVESEEMKPKWFHHENIPYDTMWADDVLWYPMVFKNQLFYGLIMFHGHDNLLSHSFQVSQDVKEMEELRNLAKDNFSIISENINSSSV